MQVGILLRGVILGFFSISHRRVGPGGLVLNLLVPCVQLGLVGGDRLLRLVLGGLDFLFRRLIGLRQSHDLVGQCVHRAEKIVLGEGKRQVLLLPVELLRRVGQGASSRVNRMVRRGIAADDLCNLIQLGQRDLKRRSKPGGGRLVFHCHDARIGEIAVNEKRLVTFAQFKQCPIRFVQLLCGENRDHDHRHRNDY